MRHTLKTLMPLLSAILSIPLIWESNHFGLWWITIAIGLCFGLFFPMKSFKIGLAALAVIGGWGGDLLWQSRTADIGGASTIIAGIVGLGAFAGYIVILITLLFAWLLCISGVWIGSILRPARPVSTPLSQPDIVTNIEAQPLFRIYGQQSSEQLQPSHEPAH